MPQRKISNVDNSTSYIPLIKKIEKRIESNDAPFFSVEFFPPRTSGAANNLCARLDYFRQLGPLFADITWHAKGNPESDCVTSSITISGVALNCCWLNIMLHIICVGMDKQRLHICLERAKNLGIRNILALRGDRDEKVIGEFNYAEDLVRFIRHNYGDYFTIAVAGYPTCHPDSESKEFDLTYLKRKVDAGADFIITQLFFESDVFIQFVKDCRAFGITVPIIPGIMPIQNFSSLEKMARISQLTLPETILKTLEPIKNNDEAVRNFGIDWSIMMCRKILQSNCTPGIHFYTLNQQYSTGKIVKALDLGNAACSKPLPWPIPVNHRRCSESVRPIFWSVRPKSYICRTNTWDEFPNGRWGNVNSPAFGSLNDYHIFFEPKKNKERLLQMWGQEIRSECDVWDIFYCYLSGSLNRFGNRVEYIAWNEENLSPETNIILNKLSYYNKHGILTINSQPNVNGAYSNDPIFGWGSDDGYVYQKAYLEFFISGKKLMKLLQVLEKYPRINYQMTNQKGDQLWTNCLENSPIAVTWGVFPGKEIIQPTIVDVVSFQVWKDEAFSLWLDKWASIYPQESQSRHILENIFNEYYLVNLVDNDFLKETSLWTILDQILE